MKECELSIVVLSFNRKEELEANIPAMCEMVASAGWELIVVDNGSTDGSIEYLRSIEGPAGRFFLLESGANLGVAGGRNLGWARASGDFILNIDDDAFICFDDVCALLDFMRENRDVGIASPRVVHKMTRAAQCDHGSDLVKISNFHGACHIVRRDVYSEVGGLDELCSFGGEELDYSIRVRNAGFEVVYIPGSVAEHNNFQRAGSEGDRRRISWVWNFSRVLFKNFPVSMAAVFSVRLAFMHFIYMLRALKFALAVRLLVACFSGCLRGFSGRSIASPDVLRFYASHQLRPDYGNVPIAVKIFRSLSSRFARD